MGALASIADALSGLLPAVEVLVGGEHLSNEGAPPRAIIVPKSDSFSAPRQNGPGNPRSIATREMSLEVHLWGEDLDSAEDMIPDFVSALRQVVGANYQLNGGSWKGQENLAKGRVYVLALNVQVPVAEPPAQTVTILAENQSDFDMYVPVTTGT